MRSWGQVPDFEMAATNLRPLAGSGCKRLSLKRSWDPGDGWFGLAESSLFQRQSWQPALYVPRGDTQAGLGGLLAGMFATHFASPFVRLATSWPIALEAFCCPHLKNEGEASQPANFFLTSLFFWP